MPDEIKIPDLSSSVGRAWGNPFASDGMAASDAWGRDETAARVVRQMVEDRERGAIAAADREVREAAARAQRVPEIVTPIAPLIDESQPADRSAEIAELVAAREEREARAAAWHEATTRQDADFHAHQINLYFKVYGISDHGTLEEDHDPSYWELAEDEAANIETIEAVKAAAALAIAPLIAHYRSLALVRADFASFSEGGEPGDGKTGPTFFLVHRADDSDLCPCELAEFPPIKIELATPPGASITISAEALPANPTMLFETMQRGGGGVGQWGGEATPELHPLADESRDEWLERVCTPRPVLGRLVERWVASGRDPYIFARYGDWTERASGAEEIEWIVNGIIPRGEIIILAGASGAGKSSIAHSWLGALGARSDDYHRHVLGRPVTGRFFCALVAGEESAGSINFREMKQSSAWGSSGYLTLDDPNRSLADHIASLDSLPNLDLVVVDTVGAFFEGDEKSTRAVREFIQPLVKLARAKNCAVILVHHLTKFGESVKSIAGMKAHVLGAGAFVSTARLAIGVIRVAGDQIDVGPFKSNVPPELLWLPVGTGCRYQLNSQAFTLDPILEKAASGSLSVEALDLICDAISEQNRLSRVVRRTGRHELWERKLPELEGISRTALRAAISDLVEADRIIDGPDGLIAVFPSLGEFEDAE